MFTDIELPLLSVLSKVERNGALLDGGLLEEQSREIAARLGELEQMAYDQAGHPFNVDSTKQLQAVLYDELKLPVLKKTPGGKPSTQSPC